MPFAALVGAVPVAAAAAACSASPDLVHERIAKHQALRIAIGKTSGLDDDPAYETACVDEEEALQALGNLLPTSVAGAAALLAYMAEVEGDFADDGSPLLRTVLSVAKPGRLVAEHLVMTAQILAFPRSSPVRALCRAGDGAAPFSPAWCDAHPPLIDAAMDLLEADDAEFALRCALMADDEGRMMVGELAGQLQRLGAHIADVADALG